MKCQQPLQTVEIRRCLSLPHAIRFNYICAGAYNCCCLALWKDNVRYLKVHKLPLEDSCFVFWCYLPDEYWNNVLPKLYRSLVAVLVFHFWHSVHNNDKSECVGWEVLAVIFIHLRLFMDFCSCYQVYGEICMFFHDFMILLHWKRQLRNFLPNQLITENSKHWW